MMRLGGDPFRRRECAAALIIVLAFVVLLTGLVVAYFSRTVTDRQAAHGSFNQTKANALALSAADLIVADLKQEIANGSVVPPTSVKNGKTTVATIYTPTSSTYMVPTRSGAPNSIPNLVRISNHSDPTGTVLVPSRASNLSSTAASSNGRFITKARWNKHYLIPRDPALYGGTNANKVGTDPDPSFVPPDWVFVEGYDPVTKQANGPTVITSPSPLVIGRYTYAIYGEGGLLDVNVAGFPCGPTSPCATTAVQSGRKGSVAFADLTLPTGLSLPQFRVDDLVGWRNYASTQPPTGDFQSNFGFDSAAAQRYFNLIPSNNNGFLAVPSTIPPWNGRTDQAVISRQQLINLRSSLGSGSGFSQDALQYLTTFSREADIPNWSPATPNSTNPSFADGSLRVTASFIRNDGTTANVGEPLVKNRFALQRLNWLTYKGPSGPRKLSFATPPAASDPDYDMWLLQNTYGLSQTFLQKGVDVTGAQNIVNYFGLVWDSTNERWNYIGHPKNPKANSPLVSSLANLGTLVGTREPDFFELLQAGIISSPTGVGSLGDKMPSQFPTAHQQSTMLQVLTIGANLIGQSTVDSYPIRIACTVNGVTMEAVGTKRLPYINMLGVCAVGSNSSSGGVSWFLIPNIWDPYRNTSDLTTLPLRPDIQITVTGTVSFAAYSPATKTTTTISSLTIGSAGTSMLLVSGSSSGGRDASSGESAKLDSGDVSSQPLQFNAYPFSSETSNGNAASSEWRSTNAISGANRYIVMRAGFPGTGIPPATLNQNPALILNPNNVANGFQVTMDYRSPTNSSKWYSYSFLEGNNDPSTWIQKTGGVQFTDTNSVYSNWNTTKTITLQSAPTQWAMTTLNLASIFMKSDPRSIRFNTVIDRLTTAGTAAVVNSIWPSGASPQNLGSGPTNVNPAWYAQNINQNINGTPVYYKDTDNQVRLGDNGSAVTNPYGTGNDSVRPLLMNRPFRSVGEMGYAFRDQPFKTLDFLTANSADVGLLDLFCVNENTNSSSLRAGTVNLNTRQLRAPAALVGGVLQTDDATPTSVSEANANTISTNLMAKTPFKNRAELVNAFAGDTTLPLTKTQHEAILRALSESGQTRTWNLMIDVVAQSGRYAPGATDLTKFVVQGEQRYWVHVAIDRFTGEVIDRQVEVVKE